MHALHRWPIWVQIIIIVLLFSAPVVRAETEMIKFTEEELPRESVLPIFDNSEAVKSKHVPFEGRTEFGFFAGATVNDPFYNTFPIGGEFRYHLTDIHALGVVASYHIQQQTQYVPQIRALNGGQNIPFEQSTSPKMMAMAEYEFTPYYGKISLTKQGVMNLSISATAAGGWVSQSSSLGTESGFGFAIGLNQRLFLTRNLGLKLDVKALFYNQNDVVPSPSQRKLFTNIWIGLGMVYFMPRLLEL